MYLKPTYKKKKFIRRSLYKKKTFRRRRQTSSTAPKYYASLPRPRRALSRSRPARYFRPKHSPTRPLQGPPTYAQHILRNIQEKTGISPYEVEKTLQSYGRTVARGLDHGAQRAVYQAGRALIPLALSRFRSQRR